METMVTKTMVTSNSETTREPELMLIEEEGTISLLDVVVGVSEEEPELKLT
jgi:hypothetical protein